MAAHAIGADQHQRPNGILRRPAHLLLAGDAAIGFARDMGERPVAVGPPLEILRRLAFGPARAGEVPAHRAGFVLQLGEEGCPARIDRAGILQPALVEVGEEGGVGAQKEGGSFEVHCSLIC